MELTSHYVISEIFTQVLTQSTCQYMLQLIRRAVIIRFDVLGAVVAASVSTGCVMETTTAATIVMKTQRSAKLTVSHSLSHYNVQLSPPSR